MPGRWQLAERFGAGLESAAHSRSLEQNDRELAQRMATQAEQLDLEKQRLSASKIDSAARHAEVAANLQQQRDEMDMKARMAGAPIPSDYTAAQRAGDNTVASSAEDLDAYKRVDAFGRRQVAMDAAKLSDVQAQADLRRAEAVKAGKWKQSGQDEKKFAANSALVGKFIGKSNLTPNEWTILRAASERIGVPFVAPEPTKAHWWSDKIDPMTGRPVNSSQAADMAGPPPPPPAPGFDLQKSIQRAQAAKARR